MSATTADARAIIRLAQPSAARFVPGVFFGLLSAVSAVALLATSAWLITRAAEQPPILFLSFAVVGVRAFALGRAFFRYIERLASHDAAFRSLSTLRVGIYRRLVPLAPTGSTTARRGELLSRLVTDVDALQDVPLRVVQPLVISALIVTLSVAGVTALLPAAGLVLLATVGLAFLVGTALDSRIAAGSDSAISALRGKVVDASMSLVRSADLLTAYGAMPTTLAELDRADAELRSAALRRAAATGAVTAALGVLGGLAVLGAALVAQPALASGSITGPEFAVLVLVPLAVFEAVAAVPLAAGAWRRVRASAARVATVAPAVVPVGVPLDGGGAELAPPGRGVSIRISDLSARWPGAASDSVSGVSVVIEPGARVLVRGDSGAGKSTLASVLVRFLDYRGSVTINGVEARELEPMSVRRVIGLCEQRPHIFDDTIRQNLLFAAEHSTDAELLGVLDRVGLREWVQRRGGLDARVGERGALVSGGQAQRIAVARALLAEFSVLILDEPTASVDPEQADELMRDILGAASGDGRSVIVLSHLGVPAGLVTQRLTVVRPASGGRGD